MTELHPWAGFDSLVDGLAQLQTRARAAAVRSVDEILTLRNWLIGAWIVAYEQEGADRARYGEGLIDALAAAFKARGVGGLGRSNLKNYRQIAFAWPTLGIRQTSGESRLLPSTDIRQTPSGESGALGPNSSFAPGSPRSWSCWRAVLRQGKASPDLDPVHRIASRQSSKTTSRWSGST
jgi:hypothetical protein